MLALEHHSHPALLVSRHQFSFPRQLVEAIHTAMAANGVENGLSIGIANGDTATGDINEASEVKMPGKPVGVQASAAVPQMSLGRWIKDTDIESQVREHAKVRLSSALAGWHMLRLTAPCTL